MPPFVRGMWILPKCAELIFRANNAENLNDLSYPWSHMIQGYFFGYHWPIWLLSLLQGNWWDQLGLIRHRWLAKRSKIDQVLSILVVEWGFDVILPCIKTSSANDYKMQWLIMEMEWIDGDTLAWLIDNWKKIHPAEIGALLICPLDTIIKQRRKKIDHCMWNACIDNTSTDTETKQRRWYQRRKWQCQWQWR